MKLYFLTMALFIGSLVQAQVDTINTSNLKLNSSALKAGKASYVVYFEDSLGNRISSADIWDRSIRFTTDDNGAKLYNFNWKWYKRDSLIADVSAIGFAQSLTPISHYGNYGARGIRSFQFANNVVTIPQKDQHNAKDSTFSVTLHPQAFEFPMDLEIFPLLPFKKVGQEFAIAFYEPGTPKSDYYKLTVTGKENLALAGGQKVACWLLRIDYNPGSYATFWITDASREVVKMQEYFRGKYRYKVRLY